MNTLAGTVQSHTVIRVPGAAYAEAAPFVLLLVKLDRGGCILGHFTDSEPPPIDTRVTAKSGDKVPVFSVAEETT
jgi:uncharacterized OB-fold protein